MTMRRRTGGAAALALILGALPAAAQTGTSPTGAPNAQPGWLARGTAELQALDKVYARSTAMQVKVGATAKFGTLAIKVNGCMSRPADQAPDAAAFLTITDGQAPSPSFRGWMFAANPALSMLAHPIYDIRVMACRE